MECINIIQPVIPGFFKRLINALKALLSSLAIKSSICKKLQTVNFSSAGHFNISCYWKSNAFHIREDWKCPLTHVKRIKYCDNYNTPDWIKN